MRDFIKLSNGVEIENTAYEEIYYRLKGIEKEDGTNEFIDIGILPGKLYHITPIYYKDSIENKGLQNIDGYIYFAETIRECKYFIAARNFWNSHHLKTDILAMYEVDTKILDLSKLYKRSHVIIEYLYNDSIPPEHLKLNGIYKLMSDNSIISYRNYLLATGQKDKVKKLNL